MEAPRNLAVMVRKMQKQHFPMIRDAHIKVILDTKPKKNKGKYRLAELRLANDFIRFFTQQEENGFAGYDYVMVVDKALVDNTEQTDQRRIVYHELCHGYKDDKDNFRLIPHDFEGFYSEIKYNEDDPDWSVRLSNLMHFLHEGGEK
jgi:hypothetical protein